MATLANFPMKDQRSEKTIDGRPPENGNFDCVAVSLAAAVQYLTGKYCSGDELKDAAYGESYTGGTALRKYVDDATDRARAVYGVSAEPFNSTSTVALIHQIRAWLRAGFPVIATIPSAWSRAFSENVLADPPFPTHVVCFFTEDGTHLGAMNPWGGFLQAEDDAWWSKRLCYGQVWKIYKEDDVLPDDYEKIKHDAIAAEAARDQLQVQVKTLTDQLQTVTADAVAAEKARDTLGAQLKAAQTTIADLQKNQLTDQQKADLALIAALRVWVNNK